MSYVEIATLQGPLIIDQDRLTGVGQATGPVDPLEGNQEQVTLVLLLSGGNVDIHLANAERAEAVIEGVKKIIVQRKVRTPSKPIVL